MAKQRFVNTRFWRDDYIHSLTPNARLLFLWAITNPETELCGAYQAAMSSIKFETGLPEKRILELFEQFAKAGKILYRDGWVIVINFTRHQNGTSTNIKKGAERTLSYCPDWVKDTLSNGIIPTDTDRYRALPKPRPRPEPTDVFTAPAISDQQITHQELILDGLRSRYNLTSLRDEQGWCDAIEWAFINGFDAPTFLECFDLLSKQKWRTGRITPKNVADNLPDLDKVKAEIAEQHNGKPKSHRERGEQHSQSASDDLSGVLDSIGADAIM